jgi:hypothetical protein
MTWLKERHAGIPTTPRCSTRNIAVDSISTLLQGEASLLFNGIFQNMAAALGAKVSGPGFGGR